jgi:OmpA family
MHACTVSLSTRRRASCEPARSRSVTDAQRHMPPLLRLQRAIGNQAVNRLIQRQIDIPIFDKLDICVHAPVVGKVCGSDAVKACEKIPSLPGCGTVCRLLGCKKPEKPSMHCPDGFRPATSKDYAGLCCRGPVDSLMTCCPPALAASNDLKCCAQDEVVIDGHCVKSSDLPPLPPTWCLPSQKTTTGTCCTIPFVPKGAECVLPEKPQPPPVPPTPQPVLSVRTFEILFKFDRPGPGEISGAALKNGATAEGSKAFDALVAALRADSSLRVQLVGKTSPEGSEAHNAALGERRARIVKAALIDAGIDAARLADPPSDGLDAGCTLLEPGLANCGEVGGSTARDRQTRARVFAGP